MFIGFRIKNIRVRINSTQESIECFNHGFINITLLYNAFGLHFRARQATRSPYIRFINRMKVFFCPYQWRWYERVRRSVPKTQEGSFAHYIPWHLLDNVI